MMKKQEIILSMQTAFLGAICNKVRLIASSIFVQNLIAFTVLFLKVFFYISVLLLRTFN